MTRSPTAGGWLMCADRQQSSYHFKLRRRSPCRIKASQRCLQLVTAGLPRQLLTARHRAFSDKRRIGWNSDVPICQLDRHQLWRHRQLAVPVTWNKASRPRTCAESEKYASPDHGWSVPYSKEEPDANQADR